MEERLQKALARAGIASRRKSEELIRQGRVEVNGQIVTELGVKINPETDEVRVDGERVRLDGAPQRTIALYKPRGVVTTASDELGRQTVLDLIPLANRIRLFPVGRLDLESEGLVLVTNDGELANRLTHPRYEHEKEYLVSVFGVPDEEDLERLRTGIYLEEGKTLPARVGIDRTEGGNAWVRIVLREGKKRQIRRMFEIVGHPVRRLIRVRLGPVELGALKPGEWRELTAEEEEALASGQRLPARLMRKQRKPGWARPKTREKRSGQPASGSRRGTARDAKKGDSPRRPRGQSTRGRKRRDER